MAEINNENANANDQMSKLTSDVSEIKKEIIKDKISKLTSRVSELENEFAKMKREHNEDLFTMGCIGISTVLVLMTFMRSRPYFI